MKNYLGSHSSPVAFLSLRRARCSSSRRNFSLAASSVENAMKKKKEKLFKFCHQGKVGSLIGKKKEKDLTQICFAE